VNRPTVSRSRHVRGGFTDTPLSRRRLLLAAAGIGVTGLAAGPLVVPRLFAQTPVEGLPLVEPEVRASRDGLLETTLECATSEVTIGGRTVSSRVYERSFPGPTLRLRPGDTLKIKLVNHLDEHTNLHTHGFTPAGEQLRQRTAPHRAGRDVRA
jgi:FtsP/CotA-like multicopper oxidase with cupredoxin domain